MAVALTTSALNWAVYALVIMLVPGIQPVIAIVIGSATAMVASYLGFARLVFRG
jgi:putative flippase GtrA